MFMWTFVPDGTNTTYKNIFALFVFELFYVIQLKYLSENLTCINTFITS